MPTHKGATPASAVTGSAMRDLTEAETAEVAGGDLPDRDPWPKQLGQYGGGDFLGFPDGDLGNRRRQLNP